MVPSSRARDPSCVCVTMCRACGARTTIMASAAAAATTATGRRPCTTRTRICQSVRKQRRWIKQLAAPNTDEHEGRLVNECIRGIKQRAMPSFYHYIPILIRPEHAYAWSMLPYHDLAGCVRACVRARVRAYMRASVRVCVRACECVCLGKDREREFMSEEIGREGGGGGERERDIV